MIRAGLVSLMLALPAAAGCGANDTAMSDCLRQFTEAECDCLKQTIPEKKWATLELLARDRVGSRSRALALSLRENAEGKCGPLEPRADALPS